MGDALRDELIATRSECNEGVPISVRRAKIGGDQRPEQQQHSADGADAGQNPELAGVGCERGVEHRRPIVEIDPNRVPGERIEHGVGISRGVGPHGNHPVGIGADRQQPFEDRSIDVRRFDGDSFTGRLNVERADRDAGDREIDRVVERGQLAVTGARAS